MEIERRIKRIRTLINRPMFFETREAEEFLKEDIEDFIKEIRIQKIQIELMANDLKSSGRGKNIIIKGYRKKAIECLKAKKH